MAQYRLISFKTCPWVQRAAIVLREKNIEFEIVHLEPNNRPDWFAVISPHGKAPVLQIDDDLALFESNAIVEYLDDAIQPRLHPQGVVERAINRAWTDYIPTFAQAVGALAIAATEPALATARAEVAKAFGRLDEALAKQSDGPYFNGERYALVDAGYAPFLQRYLILEDLAGDDLSQAFPTVRRWAEALVARPSTHTFAPDVFRALFLETLKRRGGLIAQQTLSA